MNTDETYDDNDVDDNDKDDFGGLFISNVLVGSPAETAGIRPLRLTKEGGAILGDRLVAINGDRVRDRNGLTTDMRGRVEGERLSLTVRNAGGDTRVVYVTLGRRE